MNQVTTNSPRGLTRPIGSRKGGMIRMSILTMHLRGACQTFWTLVRWR